MGNQSLNTLVLIWATFTHIAHDALCQLMAAHLLTVCQALDLRTLNATSLSGSKPYLHTLLHKKYTLNTEPNVSVTEDLFSSLWTELQRMIDATESMNTAGRFPFLNKLMLGVFIDHSSFEEKSHTLENFENFAETLASSMTDAWCHNRDVYLEHGDASLLLGCASRSMYIFVRNSSNVPFLSSPRSRTPKAKEDGIISGQASTVGSYTSTVYRAFKDATFAKVIIDVLRNSHC